MIPTFQMVNGQGTPRVIVPFSTLYTSSANTTYVDDGVTETTPTLHNITAVQILPTSTNVTVNAPAEFSIGSKVVITGNTSTPSLNGTWEVAATGGGGLVLKIGKVISVGVANGNLQLLVDPALLDITTDMRISSVFADPVSGASEATYGRILSFSGNKIVIDDWTAGNPTNGAVFKIDGWVADLPRCMDETEIFDPDVLVHRIYKSRKSFVHRGYFYSCVLDYKQHLYADALYALQHALNSNENDDMILIPRKDAPQFNYRVALKQGVPIELSQFGVGRGHRKVAFTFEGKETINSFPVIQGYGNDFGGSYGDVL